MLWSKDRWVHRFQNVMTRCPLARHEHSELPDGYPYKLSRGEMQKVGDRKIVEQKGFCAICEEPMEVYGNIVGDHILPKGAGGACRDSPEPNIQAVHHFPRNVEKGSKRT